MNINMNLSEIYNLANKMTSERLSESPDYELYQEIERQLDLRKTRIDSGESLSDDQKDEISIGLIAVREFEETDQEYSEILSKLSYLFKHPEIDSV